MENNIIRDKQRIWWPAHIII